VTAMSRWGVGKLTSKLIREIIVVRGGVGV